MHQTVFLYRFAYEKVHPATFLGHLDLVRAFGRAVRRSGLPVCYSGGFTPRPLVSFGPPLPFGNSGMEELVDVRCEDWFRPGHAIEGINIGLPGGIRITAGALIDPHPPSISSEAATANHVLKLPVCQERARKAIKVFESAQEFWVDIVKGERKRRRNLKDFIRQLRYTESLPGAVKIDMLILFLYKGTVPAREVAVAIFGLSDEEASGMEITRGRFYKSLEPPVILFIP